MRHSAKVGLLIVMLGCLPSAAQAEFIPWKYNWSRSRAIINADAPGTGFISLTDESLKGAKGSTDVVATNLRVVSTAEPSTPDVFTNADYSLTLFLLDEGSGQSGTMAFGGLFNGTVSRVSSNLTHEFVGPLERSVDLGENRYTVTIGPYTPPGPPGSSNAGAVSAFAHVQIHKIQAAPEPSTLLLSTLALPFMGAAAWRRRRSRRNEMEPVV